MKKRILALGLTLLLVLCALPFAAAAEDETECLFYLRNHLMDMNYGDMETRTEIAVGDEISVIYQDTAPAQVYVNGVKTADIDPDGTSDFYLPVKETGTIDVAVKQGDKTLLSRTFTVISSADMYKKLLKEAFLPQIPAEELFLSADELKDAVNHGFPLFNPFLPFAYLAMLTVNFFMTVFSFTRIVR